MLARSSRAGCPALSSASGIRPLHEQAGAILAALKTFDTNEDKVVQFMMDLREAPSRLWARLGGASAIAGQPRFGLHNFVLLEENADALVYGLVGRFWRLDYGLQCVETPEAFASMRMPGVAKLVMVYTVTQRADGQVDLVTETGVYCVGPDEPCPFHTLLDRDPAWKRIYPSPDPFACRARGRETVAAGPIILLKGVSRRPTQPASSLSILLRLPSSYRPRRLSCRTQTFSLHINAIHHNSA